MLLAAKLDEKETFNVEGSSGSLVVRALYFGSSKDCWFKSGQKYFVFVPSILQICKPAAKTALNSDGLRVCCP